MPRTAKIFLPLALCSSLISQGASWSAGVGVGYAQGLSLDAQSQVGTYNERSLVVTETGFSRQPPTAWHPTPGIPNLLNLPWLSIPGLDIDALSMGLDWVNATATNGQVNVPAGTWSGITVSVTRSTTGQSNSLIAGESQGAGGAAADIFSYVLPGSQGIPTNWVDRPMRAHDGREIGLNGTAPANIDAHDLYTGLLFRDAPDLIAQVAPTLQFYFSVSFTSLIYVPSNWWGGTTPSGASVLATTWNPTTASWSTPTVAYQAASLGLNNNEDLDGLALDLLRSRALISTTGTPVARNPLLFVNLTTGSLHTYRRADGVAISERLGLRPGGTDQIDGICAVDPGNTPFDFMRARGYPQAPVFPGTPVTLGVNAQSDLMGGSLISTMIGYPRPGPPLPGAAFVALALNSPTSYYDLWQVFPRPTNPFPKYQGDPIRVDFPLPADPTLAGLPVFFLWAAADTQGIDVTPPVGVILR